MMLITLKPMKSLLAALEPEDLVAEAEVAQQAQDLELEDLTQTTPRLATPSQNLVVPLML